MWASCAGVMVSRLDSRLRVVVSSNKFIASVSHAFVRNSCGTWCSGLLAWSLGCVEADLADDPRTIPAGSKPRPIGDPLTIATALEQCQTRFGPMALRPSHKRAEGVSHRLPQGLKPSSLLALCGTAEAMPYPKTICEIASNNLPICHTAGQRASSRELRANRCPGFLALLAHSP